MSDTEHRNHRPSNFGPFVEDPWHRGYQTGFDAGHACGLRAGLLAGAVFIGLVALAYLAFTGWAP
jgi:hypothetical protein